MAFKCRERQTSLQDMLTSIVPLRSHLALRGNALHDYLSSLAHISRSEAFRLAEATEKRKGRRQVVMNSALLLMHTVNKLIAELHFVISRVRVAKNYLSSGGLDLSSDDISLLNEYNSYGKVGYNPK